ncbi:UDP-glycosyltransferase 92A1-like [Coffea eugenioides]|uniref:UDP-glycosyltransferase 92A1-like n=1 Tax=Coffea eugenioides TaxID=49369 RepID=UPI000F60DFED|nr:UDP-glycosyltransferase 92A1-like [Coffea eugenioides]
MTGLKEYMVMIPFMAHGHLTPFLDLAKKIQQRTGFAITLVSTPLNVKYLENTISKDSSQESRINLESLPFNSVEHGLPPNTENTGALSLDHIIKLFQGAANLEGPFRRLIAKIIEKEGHPPLCIVSDIFVGWATDVAKDFETVNVTFTTGGAYGTAAYVSIWQNLPHRSSGKDEFSLPGFPDSCRFHITHLHRYLQAADGTDEWSKFFQPQISKSLGSLGWLCNTVEEIEPFGLDVLRKYIKLPVWCIGPLLPPQMLEQDSSSESKSISQPSGREAGLPTEQCLEWLDSHPECSVLYISFGSQNTISPSQMMALAMGLEHSGKPFIWAIRPPFGFDPKGEFKAEWLPEGFEERMAQTNQGLLVHKWAPQLEILRHKSTAAFLSHCGWNSIMESLSQGVPMIGWPLAAEQGYNSKLIMEEMGVGVELTRGLQSTVEKEHVERVINTVMEKGGKGEEMKRKAVEIRGLIRAAVREDEGHKGSSLQAIDDFISVVLSKRKVLTAS